jgi:DNA repair protein RadC
MNQQLQFGNLPALKPMLRVLRETPVRRIRQSGARNAALLELIGAVLRNPDTALQLLAAFPTLDDLSRAQPVELLAVKGLGESGMAALQAALELGRRAQLSVEIERKQIRSPADAAELMLSDMSLLEQEHLRVMLLDTRNRILAIPTIYVGNLNTSIVRVGELFREAIRWNAAGLIVFHNHPSGDPSPSPEDVAVTRNIIQVGKLMDIEVMDHIVIGQHGRYVSLKERGLGFE